MSGITNNWRNFILNYFSGVPYYGHSAGIGLFDYSASPPRKTRRIACEKIPGRMDGQTKLVIN